MPASERSIATRAQPSNSRTCLCPRCAGQLFRTWRRPVDRMRSMVSPVQRFRCEHFACQWEGNLPVSRADFVSTQARFGAPESLMSEPAQSAPPWSFVVSTSLALAGLVAVLALVIDSPFTGPHLLSADPDDYSLSVAWGSTSENASADATNTTKIASADTP